MIHSYEEIKNDLGKHTYALRDEILFYIKTKMGIDLNLFSQISKELCFQQISNTALPSKLFFSNATQNININFHKEAYNYMRHSHDFFEIIYVFSGAISQEIDGETVLLNAGDACILNPNACHCFLKSKDKEDFSINIVISKKMFQKSFYTILLNDKKMHDFFNQYMFSTYHQNSYMVFRNKKDFQKTDNLIENLIYEFLDQHLYSSIITECILIQLLAEFFRNSQSTNDIQKNQCVHDILDYLNNQYATATLQSTATYFHFHPKYLSSMIKQHTSKTFSNLLQEIKFRHAVMYLTSTNYSIEKIIYLLGYNDRSHFYSIFKKKYGVSPSEYRKLECSNAH